MSFNRERFSAALVAHLHQHKLSLREAARASGISASTLSRLAGGEVPDIESFATLCLWIGADANMFLVGQKTEEEPIDHDSGWLRLSIILQDLDVPAELIKAIITIVRATRRTAQPPGEQS